MTGQHQPGTAIQFGPFSFDKTVGKMTKHGTPMRLRGMPLKILECLIERPGEVVNRGDLQTLLWKDAVFGNFEQGLNTAMNILRRTLGDSADEARYIETVPGQGYRFIAPLRYEPGVQERTAALDSGSKPADSNQAIESTQETRGVRVAPKPPLWAIALGCSVLLAAVGLSAWSYSRYEGARHVRTHALPKIRALLASDQRLEAYDLLTASLRKAPDDPDLRLLSLEMLMNLKITTTPTGARISYRQYGEAGAPWRDVGVTPIESAQVPNAFLHFRAERPGSPAVELATWSPALNGVNIPLLSKPEDMVFVPAQARWDTAELEAQPDFFLDRFEVTNAKFKEFVEAGGYRDPKYWPHPLRKDGRELSFEQAAANFRDSTGRPGPAAWEAGGYPKQQGDFPVSGVSWFEAAAYCEFAGKALPTVAHWRRAAGFGLQSTILLHSNFGGGGPARVGLHAGISPFGAYDMAGNVKEWVWNEAGEWRYLLGGSWNEPSYMFRDADAQNPFLRDPHVGFRCAKYVQPAPARTLAPIPPAEPYYRGQSPANDETFEIYRRMYAYDKTPLEAKTEYRDEKYEDWVKEKVTYRTVYGERMAAYLYLPKKMKPPYQAVMWAPGGYATLLPSSEGPLPLEEFSYLIRTGRAVLYPVYKGTYERRASERGPNVARGTNVQFVKDIFQSVTFLESRGDIDKQRLAYKGYSLGAWIGVMALALEPRFKTGVLISGGLLANPSVGELEQLNFASRVRMPILMVGGKDDFMRPPETSQRPLFNLLGTPVAEKRLALFEGGHVAPMQGIMRETLEWLDKYLGPVGK